MFSLLIERLIYIRPNHCCKKVNVTKTKMRAYLKEIYILFQFVQSNMLQQISIYQYCLLMHQDSQSGGAHAERNNDHVYSSTTDVVRAVMDLTKGVQQVQKEQYLSLVKVSRSDVQYPCLNRAIPTTIESSYS